MISAVDLDEKLIASFPVGLLDVLNINILTVLRLSDCDLCFKRGFLSEK